MTVVFFAGSEVETLSRALMDNGVKNVLYSYWYIQQMRREGFISRLQDQYPDVNWFLDSGAFTYWMKYQNEPEKLIPWREYKERYYTYIDETWDRWSRIAELDLDRTFDEISDDMLNDWLEEMLDRWPAANIMPVWHGNRGLWMWTKYCRDPRIRHLAIGSGSKILGMSRRMVMEAHTRNKTVHGFGMTKVRIINLIPYDSVDSTSWLMGQKFGTIFVFKDNKFTLVGKDKNEGKKARRKYRTHFRKIGIDPELIEADNVAEVRKANIIAWKRLSERLFTIRKRQGRTLFPQEPHMTTVLNETLPWDAPRFREQRMKEAAFARERSEGLKEVYAYARETGPSMDYGRERTEADLGERAAKWRPDSRGMPEDAGEGGS